MITKEYMQKRIELANISHHTVNVEDFTYNSTNNTFKFGLIEFELTRYGYQSFALNNTGIKHDKDLYSYGALGAFYDDNYDNVESLFYRIKNWFEDVYSQKKNTETISIHLYDNKLSGVTRNYNSEFNENKIFESLENWLDAGFVKNMFFTRDAMIVYVSKSTKENEPVKLKITNGFNGRVAFSYSVVYDFGSYVEFENEKQSVRHLSRLPEVFKSMNNVLDSIIEYDEFVYLENNSVQVKKDLLDLFDKVNTSRLTESTQLKNFLKTSEKKTELMYQMIQDTTTGDNDGHFFISKLAEKWLKNEKLPTLQAVVDLFMIEIFKGTYK